MRRGVSAQALNVTIDTQGAAGNAAAYAPPATVHEEDKAPSCRAYDGTLRSLIARFSPNNMPRAERQSKLYCWVGTLGLLLFLAFTLLQPSHGFQLKTLQWGAFSADSPPDERQLELKMVQVVFRFVLITVSLLSTSAYNALRTAYMHSGVTASELGTKGEVTVPLCVHQVWTETKKSGTEPCKGCFKVLSNASQAPLSVQ